MPELPNTYARRPAPRFGGVRRANPVVVDGDFAEGQAMQRFGADVAQTFVGLQLQADKFELEDMTTQYRREALALENDWQTKKGSQVARDPKFYSDYVARGDQLKAKYLEKASNHRVSNSLAQRLEIADINLKESLISYITKENEVYQTEVYKGKMAVNIDTMAAHAYNDAEIAQARDSIVEAASLYAEANGLPDELRESMIKENLTRGHAAVITQMIDDGQYAAAEAHFKDVVEADEITGDVRAKLNKMIKEAGVRGRSQDFVDGMVGKFIDDPTAGYDYIRKNAPTPEIKDDAMARFKTRIAEKQAAEVQFQKDQYDQGASIYIDSLESGMSPVDAWEQIPKSVLDGMGGRQKASLYNQMQADIRGVDVQTDNATFIELMEQAYGDGASRRAFKERNLRELAGNLSPTHYAYFKKLQVDEQEYALAQTQAEFKREIATAAGYYDDKSGKKKDEQGILDVEERWTREMISFTESTGRKPSLAEQRDIADRMKIKVLQKGRFYGYNEYTASTVKIPGVPAEIIDELAYSLQRALEENTPAGQEVPRLTAQQIKDYYEYRKNRGTIPDIKSSDDYRRRGYDRQTPPQTSSIAPTLDTAPTLREPANGERGWAAYQQPPAGAALMDAIKK